MTSPHYFFIFPFFLFWVTVRMWIDTRFARDMYAEYEINNDDDDDDDKIILTAKSSEFVSMVPTQDMPPIRTIKPNVTSSQAVKWQRIKSNRLIFGIVLSCMAPAQNEELEIAINFIETLCYVMSPGQMSYAARRSATWQKTTSTRLWKLRQSPSYVGTMPVDWIAWCSGSAGRANRRKRPSKRDRAGRPMTTWDHHHATLSTQSSRCPHPLRSSTVMRPPSVTRPSRTVHPTELGSTARCCPDASNSNRSERLERRRRPSSVRRRAERLRWRRPRRGSVSNRLRTAAPATRRRQRLPLQRPSSWVPLRRPTISRSPIGSWRDFSSRRWSRMVASRTATDRTTTCWTGITARTTLTTTKTTSRTTPWRFDYRDDS